MSWYLLCDRALFRWKKLASHRADMGRSTGLESIPEVFDQESILTFSKDCREIIDWRDNIDSYIGRRLEASDPRAVNILLEVLLANGSQFRSERGLSERWAGLFEEWIDPENSKSVLSEPAFEDGDNEIVWYPSDTLIPEDPNRPPPFPSMARIIYDMERAVIAEKDPTMDKTVVQALVDRAMRPVEQDHGGIGGSEKMQSAILSARRFARRYLLTNQGDLGRLHAEPQEGDLVCVIFGCAMPMLLRPVEEHYQVLGEVYLNGIMNGEAMDALYRGEKESTTFELR